MNCLCAKVVPQVIKILIRLKQTDPVLNPTCDHINGKSVGKTRDGGIVHY